MMTTRTHRARGVHARQLFELPREENRWIDVELEPQPQLVVTTLLQEARRCRIPEEFLWDYAADRWGELFEDDYEFDDDLR